MADEFGGEPGMLFSDDVAVFGFQFAERARPVALVGLVQFPYPCHILLPGLFYLLLHCPVQFLNFPFPLFSSLHIVSIDVFLIAAILNFHLNITLLLFFKGFFQVGEEGDIGWYILVYHNGVIALFGGIGYFLGSLGI